MASKQLWRSWAIAQAWTPNGELIRSGIETFIGSRDLPTVLTYSAMPGEADLGSVDGAGRLLLTRTPAVGELTVHRADSRLEMYRWGYLQPVEESLQVRPDEIDIVLVPGVVFDRRGGRLGHGRGYYDRLLARCRPDVIRVGVTTVRALVEELPTEPHDVPMTHLATERGVHPVDKTR